MTQSPRAPSLPQARNNHNHLHLHNRGHSHETTHHQPRQLLDELDSLVTQVIQTVSLVQIVDSAGLPIEIQTFYAPPATVVVDPASGLSVDISVLDSTSTLPTPEPIPDILTDDTAQSTTPPATDAAVETLTSQDSLLTSAPSSASVPFPTLSAAFNGTNPFFNSSLPTNSSLLRAFNGSEPTTVSSTSPTLLLTSTTDFITSTVFTSTASLDLAGPTPADGAGGATGAAGGEGSASPSQTAIAASTESDPPTPTGTVVGSVVGSVAGAAILVFLVLFALKWKKRQSGRLLLVDDPQAGSRGLFSRGGVPDGNGSGSGGMVQRSLTFGVPAALAALAGSKRYSRPNSQPAETGERGFYRVSGKKLPSVLQSGGDGYTDPRESVLSNESVYYRDSQAFFEPATASSPRLAVGSPMRPVSGIPIMRSGPARTPVTESAGFFDTLPPLDFPPRDPIGRSLTSQDGSRDSNSRFTEHM